MQPGEEIESLVDELEDLVTDGKKPIMGGQGGNPKIVDADEVYSLLDEIRRVFPDEFQAARRIVKEQDEILAHAHQTADSIVADAQQQAMILAGDQEVVRLANQQADEIRDQASQYERDLRYHINEYAEGVLTGIEDNLNTVIAQLQRSRQALDDGSGRRQ